MPATLPAPASRRHLDRLENAPAVMAKANLKKVEIGEAKEDIGRVVGRMCALANCSRKEVAALVGRDEAQLARWIAGQERPQFDAIFAVKELQKPLIQALAELAGDVIVETVVRMRSEGR